MLQDLKPPACRLSGNAIGAKLPVLMLCVITTVQAADRRSSFDDNWRFYNGEASGAEAQAFNDADWRQLNLPHDWAIEGPFDAKHNPHTGGLPVAGVGWYRKHFRVNDRGKYYTVEFDGAMSNSRVWLNGREIGGRPYGYSSFEVDLTPYLNYDGDNVIAVRLAPEENSSRWYPGAGIYRNVWLVITGPVHVAHWGTYVTTANVSDANATVAVRTELRNRKSSAARVTVETAVLDAAGKQVSSDGAGLTIAANQNETTTQRLNAAHPQRWDVTHPYLYQAVTTVRAGRDVLDRYVTQFGIRTIEYSREQGFLLNGRVMKLHGVCNHHDLGALGAAVNRRATERQLQIMKSMGVNAIRTSQ